jgi:hypothetical protein
VAPACGGGGDDAAPWAPAALEEAPAAIAAATAAAVSMLIASDWPSVYVVSAGTTVVPGLGSAAARMADGEHDGDSAEPPAESLVSFRRLPTGSGRPQR